MVRSTSAASAAQPATLGELRASGWRSRTVKEELRANLLARLAAGRPGPARRSSATRTRSSPRSRTRSSPARTSSSSASAARPRRGWPALLVELLDEWLPVVRGGELNDDPFAPISPAGRAIVERARRRDADRLAAARPALRREAGDARHHDRRPHRRGRPDQGRRGPLPVRRADAPLRADPAGEPRHLRDQRAARPRRADPGRPAQHPRGARRPDPRLHGPPAARPVRRRLGQPRGLHDPRPDHHAAQGPPRVADPDALPADARRTRWRSSARRSSASPRERRPGRASCPAFMEELVAELTHLARRSPEISQRSGVSVRVIGRERRGARGGRAQAGGPPRRAASARRASPTSARSSPRPSARSSSSRSATRRPRSGSSSGSSRRRCTRRSAGASSLDDLDAVVDAFEDGLHRRDRRADAVARVRRAGCARCPGCTTRSDGSARSTSPTAPRSRRSSRRRSSSCSRASTSRGGINKDRDPAAARVYRR